MRLKRSLAVSSLLLFSVCSSHNPGNAGPVTGAFSPAENFSSASPALMELFRLGESAVFSHRGEYSAPVPAFGISEESRLKPGRALVPEIKDEVRTRVILKLIGDIASGKPLPFPKDGTVFGNVEGLLIKKPKGYYREYTVIVPGRPKESHEIVIGDKTYTVSQMLGERGPERLVIGGGEIVYYSPDHYRTFIRLDVVE